MYRCDTVIPKVRRTMAKVRQKLSWTDKIILIVRPIDRLTYARKYFISGKFWNNCQIKMFDHCSHSKFSLSLRKIPFLFLKYWYGDFSNCRKGILNPYLCYALNNESCMAKFQAIICHRSFVEIKMLGLRYVAGAIPGKSLKRKTTESDDKRDKTKKYEENRKARKFNVKWLTNREWLDYDDSNDIMTCKICKKHSSRQTSSNLTNTNKFSQAVRTL